MDFYTHVAVHRGRILVRGIRDGKQYSETVDYKPYHFVPSREPSEFRSIDGKNLARIDFGSISDARDYLKKYEDVENFDVYGFKRYQYTYIRDNYKDTEYDFDMLSTVYFDIETNASNGFPDPDIAAEEVTAVSFRKGPLAIILGLKDYVPHRPEITYIKCRDEKELLFKFLDVWHKLSPDIISGWNIEFFDIPYIVNRMINVIGEANAKSLSPWNNLREYSVKDKWGGEKSSYELLGITTADMLTAYKKFSFKEQESYTLDAIAEVELGEKKVDYSEYASLDDLYRKNHQKYIEYNMHDSDLVLRLAEKTGLIRQIVALAYDARVNFADAFTSVLLWEVIIDNHLASKGLASPSTAKRNYKKNAIMGAFVKEPKVGKHGWVVGLDLDSLYPHLIMQYNISPETFYKSFRQLRDQLPIEDILAGELRKNTMVREMMDNHNCGYTPNGCFFKNDKRGFLPALMDSMYTDRKKYKKLMNNARKDKEVETDPKLIKKLEALITQFNNLQMAKKICLNSAYGALSNEWFSFYDIDLAEAITYAGQLAIKWIAQELNIYLNDLLGTKGVDYVLASDTDSAYLTLDALVKKVFPNGASASKIVEFLRRVCEDKINPLIEVAYEKLRAETNGFEQKMSMKVESISESGIWKKKKRYALLMHWDEGVTLKTPKVKIKGMEAVQSSTPKICRNVMKECLELILRGEKDKLFTTVDNFEKVFRASKFEEVAFTTSISDVEKYQDSSTIYAKGSLAHIRGALLYNHYIKEMGLTKKYKRVMNGDKIKTAWLRAPNPIKDNVMSVPEKLPTEFGIDKCIDYDKQFDNEFLSPINGIAQLVGWDLKNRATLEAFFG